MWHGCINGFLLPTPPRKSFVFKYLLIVVFHCVLNNFFNSSVWSLSWSAWPCLSINRTFYFSTSYQSLISTECHFQVLRFFKSFFLLYKVQIHYQMPPLAVLLSSLWCRIPTHCITLWAEKLTPITITLTGHRCETFPFVLCKW